MPQIFTKIQIFPYRAILMFLKDRERNVLSDAFSQL